MVAMYMKVPPKNRKELSQAITSLLSLMRSEKGCIRCDFFHGMDNENFFCLLQEWQTRKDFETYRESENYKVLQGAMHLLEEPCEIISCTKCSKNKLIKDINSLVKRN
jgi:quinol monooxygenase YgiN